MALALRLKIFLLCLVLLCGYGSFAHAAEWHVATSGNDGNNGNSLGTAWRNVNTGINRMNSGDTLTIHAGTYNECCWVLTKNNIIIRGNPGDTVILKPTSGSHNEMFMLDEGNGATNVTLRNLTFDGTNQVYTYGIRTFDNTRSTFDQLTIIRARNQGVAMYCGSAGGDACGPGNNTMTNSTITLTGGGPNTGNCCPTNNPNCGNECDNQCNGTTALDGYCHGLYIYTTGNTFDHVESYNNNGWGFQCYGSATLKNSKLHNNGSGGMTIPYFVDAYNLIITNNQHKGVWHQTQASTYRSLTVVGNSEEGFLFPDTSNSGGIVQNSISVNNSPNVTNQAGVSVTNSITSGSVNFVNAGGDDYHLASNANNAIDKGANLGSPYNVDFDGNMRPKGTGYDIGAYEFTGTSANVTDTLTGDKSSVVSGGAVNLTWTSSNATSCTASPVAFNSGNQFNGSATVNPTSNTTYQLSCAGPGGPAVATWPVTIITGSGTTWHVAKTGNNSNNCTSASTACLTIAAGLGKMNNGDTLIIHAGVYDEYGFNPTQNNITIQGASGDTVTIRPTSAYNGFEDVFFINGTGNTISNLIMDGINETFGNCIQLDGPMGLKVDHVECAWPRRSGFLFLCSTADQPNCAGDSNPNGNNTVTNSHAHHAGAGPSGCWASGDPTPTDGICHGVYVYSMNNTVDHMETDHNNGFGVQSYGELFFSNSICHENFAGCIVAPQTVHAWNIVSWGDATVGGGGAAVWSQNGPSTYYSMTITGSHGDGLYYQSPGNSGTITRNVISIGSSGQNLHPESGVGTFSNNITAGTVAFVNPGSNDYHLDQSASNAINAGFTLGSPYNTDLDGNARPFPAGGQYDIGAYEFTGAAGTPTATLTVSSNSIVLGASVTLQWGSTNAPSCQGSPAAFNTGNATQGSITLSPTSTTTYVLTCGSATDSKTVNVTPAPPTSGPFYVDTVAGNDANSCATAQTITTPKKTIASALPCPAAGGTILIRAGTYNEVIRTQVTPITGGTDAAHPTTIAAYQSEVVTLAPTGQPAAVIFLNNSDAFLVFDKLILDAGGGNHALSFYPGTHDSIFQNGEARNAAFEVIYTTNATNNKIIKSKVHTNTSTNGLVGISTTTTGFTLDQNEFYDSPNAAIEQQSTDVSGTVITRNKFHDIAAGAGKEAITLQAGTALVANNAIYGGNSGIQLSTGTTGAKIYNNTIYGRPVNGIQIDSGASGNAVINNIAFGNGTNILNNGATTTLTTNITTDPSFVNAAGGDFHIPATSVAKGAGTTLAEVTVDLEGTARTVPYDAGAYVAAGGTPGPFTVYVDTANLGGTANDSTACGSIDIAHPRKTIGAGLGCMTVAASKMFIRAGTYAEAIDTSVNVIASGTDASHMTQISAYGTEKVTLVTTSAPNGIVNLSNVAFVLVNGLTLQGGNASGGVVFTGGTHDSVFQYGEVSGVPFEAVMHNGGSNNVVRGSLLHDSQGGNGTALIAQTTGSSNFLVETCEIYNGPNAGFLDKGTGTFTSPTISRNSWHNLGTATGVAAISLQSTTPLVMNNVVYGGNVGILLRSGTGTGKIYNNTVTGRAGNGIQIDAGASSNAITNNISFNNGTNIVNNGTGTTQTTNTTADPSFTDPAHNNYHIPATSVAKGAGTTLAEVTMDFDGKARTTPYDTGAYVYTVPPVLLPGLPSNAPNWMTHRFLK